MASKRETPNQKLKRELIDVRRKLFKVCTDPESGEAQQIILDQKILQHHTLRPAADYSTKLKEMGLGRAPDNPFEHYETPKK